MISKKKICLNLNGFFLRNNRLRAVYAVFTVSTTIFVFYMKTCIVSFFFFFFVGHVQVFQIHDKNYVIFTNSTQ